ncbi:MAG: hypothetical protein ALAOOOJD_00621 [bacterium]|nr:hypothetical protein [bacterium]
MLYEIGILFTTDDLKEADYQQRAWQIFMMTCDPLRLPDSTLYDGEISETGMSHEEAFCIAVQTQDRHLMQYLKKVFMFSDAPGLMSREHRFIERGVTLRYPLSLRGRIDTSGQFCSWQENFVRRDHQLCHEAGWAFGGAVNYSPDYKREAVLVEETNNHEVGNASRPRSGSGSGSGGKADPLPHR